MRAHDRVRRLTLTALLAALALAVLYGACLVPSGKLGLAAAAGLAPAVAVLRAGVPAGFLCYAGTAILALLLLPSKLPALFFIALVGHYPVCRALLERVPNPALRWALKLLLANALFFLLRQFAAAVFLPALPDALSSLWMYYLAGNIAFVVYDVGLSRLLAPLAARLPKR